MEPLDAVAVCARRRSSSRRAGSRRARRRSARSGAARLRGGRPDRAVEQALEEVERLQELERALLDPRLDVAGGALGHDGLEAVVGEPRAVRAHVVGESGGARGRARRAEPLARRRR